MPQKFSDRLYDTVFWMSLVGLLLFIADYGFNQSHLFQLLFDYAFFGVILAGAIATLARYFNKKKKFTLNVLLFDILYVLVVFFLVYTLISRYSPDIETFVLDKLWTKVVVLVTFIREVSERTFNFRKFFLNPAQIFIVSFLIIILLGSIVLLFPNSTYEGISFIDALFTSTSAVCVTGLFVVDTATYFTTFGQTVIMILIQLGGLGILTFAAT